MKLDKLQRMVQDCKASGNEPRTIVLTEADAKSLGIPMWTKHLFGLKVVIAHNTTESKVTHHIYEEVTIKRREDANRNT